MKLKIDNNNYNFQYSDVRKLFLYNKNNIDIKLWLNEITIYAR